MAIHEEVIDWVTGQISHIGLSSDGATEISGGGYAALVPSYAAAAAGSADLQATLEFDGTPGTQVTHLIFKKAGAAWVIRPVTAQTFNSNGRLDVTSAVVTSAFPA